MKKRNKFELWSIPGVALIIIIILAIYYGYHYINKINAYTAMVPTTIDSGQQSPTDETVLYLNINKDKYGKYDYIEGIRGELIVQLNDRVPLYRIVEIADRYGLRVESRYSMTLPSFVLRIVDPGDDIGSPTMRIVDPGEDIGSYTANYLRKQGLLINPSVEYDTPVSSGYLESIWRQLESIPDIYSVTLNTVN